MNLAQLAMLGMQMNGRRGRGFGMAMPGGGGMRERAYPMMGGNDAPPELPPRTEAPPELPPRMFGKQPPAMLNPMDAPLAKPAAMAGNMMQGQGPMTGSPMLTDPSMPNGVAQPDSGTPLITSGAPSGLDELLRSIMGGNDVAMKKPAAMMGGMPR